MAPCSSCNNAFLTRAALIVWLWLSCLRVIGTCPAHTAGRFKEACELCANAGQSWRAVSLAGAGPWGPLPVGEAAVKASLPAAQGGDMQVC